MSNHTVPSGHGIRVSKSKAAPHIRLEIIDESIHHSDQMEGGTVELIGTIVLASPLDLVGPLSEAIDAIQQAAPEGPIILISIDID